ERTGDRTERLAEKYGMSVQQAREAEERLTAVAAGEDLPFRFDIARSGTTFDGHRLVHLAETHDLQDAMKERLLRAYFTEGELISDHDTLVRLAVEVGLDEQEVRELLAGERYADEVRADERTAGELGISAVATSRHARASAATPRSPRRRAPPAASPGSSASRTTRGRRTRGASRPPRAP